MGLAPYCNRIYLARLLEDFIPSGYSERLIDLFWQLYDGLGSQNWWPGDTPFEIAIGAILTQNTSWTNVEKAISNLKERELLEPEKLYALSADELAYLIKPAGYYNIKAKRLRNFLCFLMERYAGDLDRMAAEDDAILRQELLDINGIGPETADSIMLYALEKPSFVIDAYTLRILVRHDLIEAETDYHQARELFMDNLPADTCLFNEYHALFVNTGKNFCKKRNPLCSNCPLQGL